MQQFALRISIGLSVALAVILIVARLILTIVPVGGFGFFIVLITALLLFLFIAYCVVLYFIRPLEETEMMIQQLRRENFKIRTYSYGQGPAGRVNRLLNDLAGRLEKTKQSLANQQDQLATLIENIGSSFIFIDNAGRVRMTNHVFQQTFQVAETESYHHKYQDVLPYEEVTGLIGETIVKEVGVRRTVVVPMGIERRYFDVYCAPIKHGYSRSKGVVAVFHDITDLKKLEKVRKDFVANVSHELKTPVTSLRGFAETLLEEDGDNDENLRRRFLKIIEKESERLEALIDDLLELSRIENETFRLHLQAVDLRDIAENIVMLLHEKAKAKHIKLQTFTEGNTIVQGDPSRLKQMLMNVVDNAIVYSPEDSDVSVKIKESGDAVTFVVEDNGIGIDTKEIPRIFERFYRVDKGRSRNSGGTGLGLAIVKHLTEAHGGRIDVKSLKGAGTAFKITLPKKRTRDQRT